MYISGWANAPSGGKDFRVDIKADIKWDYRGDIRKYFKESKVVLRTQEELVRVRYGPGWLKFQGHA